MMTQSSKKLLVVLFALLLTAATGCGRSHYCTNEAPRLEVAVSQSIRLGHASPYLRELAASLDKEELSRAASHLNDPRFTTLRHSLENLSTQCERDFINLRTMGNELMARYCEVPLPGDRCIAAINRLMFGNMPSTVEACGQVQTASGAACVEAVAAARSMDIAPEEILACSRFYYPKQAACVATVSTLTYALRAGTIAACENVYRADALACVQTAVASTVMDIEEATIAACGAPTIGNATTAQR